MCVYACKNNSPIDSSKSEKIVFPSNRKIVLLSMENFPLQRISIADSCPSSYPNNSKNRIEISLIKFGIFFRGKFKKKRNKIHNRLFHLIRNKYCEKELNIDRTNLTLLSIIIIYRIFDFNIFLIICNKFLIRISFNKKRDREDKKILKILILREFKIFVLPLDA